MIWEMVWEDLVSYSAAVELGRSLDDAFVCRLRGVEERGKRGKKGMRLRGRDMGRRRRGLV